MQGPKARRAPTIRLAKGGRRRPVVRRPAAQQLVDENTVSVDDAPLRGRQARELLGRYVSWIACRRLHRGDLIGQAESSKDRQIGPSELQAVTFVDDHVGRGQGKIREAEIEGDLERLPDPHCELERSPRVERRYLLQ